MTKKDYELIAKVISDSLIPTRDAARIAQDFADVLYSDNPRFRRETFYVACGMPWLNS